MNLSERIPQYFMLVAGPDRSTCGSSGEKECRLQGGAEMLNFEGMLHKTNTFQRATTGDNESGNS